MPDLQRREEITTQQGCLLWGMRVIIPTKCQRQVLQQIHEGHVGTVERNYWPVAISGGLERMN